MPLYMNLGGPEWIFTGGTNSNSINDKYHPKQQIYIIRKTSLDNINLASTGCRNSGLPGIQRHK